EDSRARIATVTRARQLGERLALLVVEILRDLDLELVVDVAALARGRPRRPFAAEPLDGPVLGPGCDPDPLRATQRRHLDVGAADSLAERDRHLDLEVAVGPAVEDRRGRHPGRHEQVPGRSAERSVLALAGEPDPRPVLDAGGDVDAVALALQRQPGAAAVGARMLDDLAAAAALGTGLADREEALTLRIDAPPLAARADDRLGPRRRSVAVAGRAGRLLRHRDRDLRALHRLLEAERDLSLEVATAHRLGTAAT